MRTLLAAAAAAALSMMTAGCSSLSMPAAAPPSAPSSAQAEIPPLKAGRVLGGSNLGNVIRRGLTEPRAARYLGRFTTDGVDLPRPGTNWTLAAVGGGTSNHTAYFLTWRDRYVVLLMADESDGSYTCVDALTLPRQDDD